MHKRHRLSSSWTMITAVVFVMMNTFGLVLSIFMQAGDDYAIIFCGFLLSLSLIYGWYVRSLTYDDEQLYIYRFFRAETFSLGEVSAINVPQSWGDRMYQVELKSGRTIDFLPDYPRFSMALFWEKQDIPSEVRRFQATVRNFERDHGS